MFTWIVPHGSSWDIIYMDFFLTKDGRSHPLVNVLPFASLSFSIFDVTMVTDYSLQWNNGIVVSYGGSRKGFGEWNFLCVKPRGNKSCTGRGDVSGLLFQIFPHPKKGGIITSNTGFMTPQFSHQKIQIQKIQIENVNANCVVPIYTTRRLVHVDISTGCLFPHKHLPALRDFP